MAARQETGKGTDEFAVVARQISHTILVRNHRVSRLLVGEMKPQKTGQQVQIPESGQDAGCNLPRPARRARRPGALAMDSARLSRSVLDGALSR